MTNVKHCEQVTVQSLKAWLGKQDVPAKKALIGFDGYVDTLYHAVRCWTPAGQPEFYQTIAQYGVGFGFFR